MSESNLNDLLCADTEYKGIKHGSTVVVCSGLPEFRYLSAWCEVYGKLNLSLMKDPEAYPFCVATKDGGWTDRMDRALYYKSFSEFLDDIGT